MLSHSIVRACAGIAIVLVGCSDDAAPAGTADSAVWAASSEGFTFHVVGGLEAPPFPGTCTHRDYEYTYTASTGTLRHRGCYSGRQLDVTVVLDATARAAVASQMTSLRPTSDLGCGADLPEMVLTINGPGSATRRFNSSFYGRCPERMLAPPFIGFMALQTLDAFLATTVSTCAGDGGLRCTSRDAGVDGG